MQKIPKLLNHFVALSLSMAFKRTLILLSDRKI